MKKTLGMIIVALILAIIFLIAYRRIPERVVYQNATNKVDVDTIEFEKSGTTVHFADVILAKQNEKRKLIVVEQETSVSTDLEDRLIDQLDFDILKRTQKVTYKGEGSFVVNLDNLKEGNVIQDDDNKLITIKIDRPHLDTIEIDPENIIIDDVQQGLLTWGDLKLSVMEYREIENEIRSRMEENLNTASNVREADDNGLRMVKEIYEPIIKAIDDDYSVAVEYVAYR